MFSHIVLFSALIVIKLPLPTIHVTSTLDCNEMLLAHFSVVQVSDDVIQFTAITWLREFITLSGRTMLPFIAGILKSILPCMAYEQDKQNIL